MAKRKGLDACTASHLDAEWAEASRLWDDGEPREAFRRMSALAKAGHPSAQGSLGYFYDTGVGTRPNVTRALYWYRRAAANGEASAANNIGIVYRDRRRPKLALRWLRRAAEMGDTDALLEAAKLLGDSAKEQRIACDWLREVIASELVAPASRTEARSLLRRLAPHLSAKKRAAK